MAFFSSLKAKNLPRIPVIPTLSVEIENILPNLLANGNGQFSWGELAAIRGEGYAAAHPEGIAQRRLYFRRLLEESRPHGS